MGLLQNTVVSFLILIFSVSLVISICFIFDSITFPLNSIKKPFPLTQHDLFPKNLKLLNLPHFQYIINNDICSTDIGIKAIIIITSHAGDIEARSAQRRAYPSDELKKMGIRRIFLLAVSTPRDDIRYNAVSQHALEDENSRYSDLLQGNFNEAYRNLTYKHVMGLQWVSRYCYQAQFVIKMDDDIIVDFYRILNTVYSNLDSLDRPFLMGYVLKGAIPVREPANKWYVTKAEYSGSLYPPFLSGWLYVTTPKVAKILTEASKSVRYFWIDDTYVTGMLANVTGVGHIDIHQHFTIHPEYLECCIRDEDHICDYIVGPSDRDSALLLRFEKHAASCNLRQCPQRPPNEALNRTCVAPKRIPPLRHGHGEITPIQLF